MRYARFAFGRMTARMTKMQTKFLVAPMAQSVSPKGAQIIASSEHHSAKTCLMFAHRALRNSSPLNNTFVWDRPKCYAFFPVPQLNR